MCVGPGWCAGAAAPPGGRQHYNNTEIRLKTVMWFCHISDFSLECLRAGGENILMVEMFLFT